MKIFSFLFMALAFSFMVYGGITESMPLICGAAASGFIAILWQAVRRLNEDQRN